MENSNSPKPNSQATLVPEREHTGTIWKHPYFIYIYLTVVLFLGLVIIGWLGMENGWIPSRGIENVGTSEMQSQ